LYNRFSIATENSHSVNLEPVNDRNLTIGIIGDSWVAGGTVDNTLQLALKTMGLNATVFSSGQGGAKTKEVYRNLFANDKDVFSSAFIKNEQVKYCVVCCGVNDSFGQYGKRYYAKNMCLIIKELLKYNIKPVIVELPTYGVYQLQEQLHFHNKIKNEIFAFFNSDSGIDNIKEYRAALAEELKKQLLRDKIIFVDYDVICSDYSKCPEYYSDYLHLTTQGNYWLCDEIAKSIDSDWN
jgi:lysophospholipase L1-like esterase